jgi:phosphatidylglycerophosphatase A
VIDRLCLEIATGVHLSYIPGWLLRRTPLSRLGLPPRWTGGGLVGTALGWALVGLLPSDGWSGAAALAAAAGAAVFVCGRAESVLGGHDDPRIIFDETVGFWFAAYGHPRAFAPMLAAFLLFRVFDASKPGPLRRLDALPGGLGVTIDDLAAGVLANLSLCALALAFPALA